MWAPFARLADQLVGPAPLGVGAAANDPNSGVLACTAAGAAWRLGANPGPHADGALAFIEQVLGDSNDDYIYIDHIDRVQIEAMRRNCSVDKYEKELRHRIIELRLFYDWPALKSAVRIWPASDSGRFKINDLWNVLD